MTKRKKTNVKELPPSTGPINDIESAIETLPDSETSFHIGKRQVEMPFVDLVVGYVTNRVDTGHTLTEKQRTNLRKIQNGLIQDAEKLESGKPVKTGSDVIKWILESVG